ncbi:MAG: hypothetical protein ICV62_00400 [Cyanobacteria bacterium Co-bin13]|nr:hypothetical protein [Cyanobacteria bacterium Co-bin13]
MIPSFFCSRRVFRVLPLLSGLTAAWLVSLPVQTGAQTPNVPVPPQSLPIGVRGEQGACLVSPQETSAGEAIFSTRPVFVWQGATISRIELTDVTEGRVTWSGRPELPVPQIAYHSTPLTPGNAYSWTLYGQAGDVLGTAPFRVMTAEQRADVDSALNALVTRLNQEGRTPAEINVAVVDYFNNQGLWSDAITAAVNANPRSPILGRYVLTTRDRICGR